MTNRPLSIHLSPISYTRLTWNLRLSFSAKSFIASDLSTIYSALLFQSLERYPHVRPQAFINRRNRADSGGLQGRSDAGMRAAGAPAQLRFRDERLCRRAGEG